MKRLLPWLLPFLVTLIALLSLDVPLGPIAKYSLYFALGVALPGILLLRALWRSTGNWAEDIGLGSAVGATYQLAGWAIFTALGWQSWLVVWPALILVVFAAVPVLRKHWLIAEPKPLPLLWTWGMVIAATVLLGGTVLGAMKYHPAPPDGTSYYQDLLYHLSMLNELTRSVPPQLPQVAGEPLEYHWFPNADMAASVDITKLSPIIVLYRLWLLPQLLVALLVIATLVRTVSRAWWTGVLAAAALAGPQLFLFFDASANLSAPLSLLSPSQTFGMIAGTAAAVFLIDLLFRGGRREGLVVAGVHRRVGRRRFEANRPADAGRCGRADRAFPADQGPAVAVAIPRGRLAVGRSCGCDDRDGRRQYQRLWTPVPSCGQDRRRLRGRDW